MVNSNPKKYYIYEWFIKDTQEVFYVGKGCGQRYKTRKRENEYFMKMLNSHESDVRKVKTNLSEDEAFDEEVKLIAYYREKTDFRLTNIADGGNQPPTYSGQESFSKLPEVKAKISNSNKEVWKSKEHREKMSKVFKDYYKTENGKANVLRKYNNCLGIPIIKAIANEKMRNTMRSDEFKQRHSKTMQKAYKSEDVREKVRGANNGASRRIRQYDIDGNFIEEFESLMKAYEVTGLNYKNISKALNGHRKTAYGYVWKFADSKKITYSKRKPYTKNINRNRKSILQYDLNGIFIKEYESVYQATEENNYKNHTNIIINLKGRSKSAYGYVWKYKEPQIQDNTVPSEVEDTK